MMEVEFVSGEVVKINKNNIEIMKENARNNEISKFRYCFHKNENAGMQEMLFLQGKEVYGRPHKHIEFAETQVLIEGNGIAIIFDEKGKIKQCFKISLSDYRIWRFEKNVYHMLIPLSKEIIIFEAREGSFNAESSVFPEWEPSNESAIKQMYRLAIEQCE